MTVITQGNVTLTIQDDLQIPVEAGNLSVAEVRRLTRARHGIGFACQTTADAMAKNPQRLVVAGLTAAELADKGRQADSVDTVINDLETLLLKMKQANLLLDYNAHEALRRVLAAVRAQEKFDPHLASLVPQLITYFANQQHDKPETPPPQK